MEIFLKRFLETTTKRSPSKISLSREKKDVHQPLKTTTEEEERTIERTMLATDVNGKAPFERLREFQRLAIARSLAYRGLYLKKTWLKDKKSEIRRLQTLCLRLSVSCLSRARRSRHVFFTLLLATMATDLRSVLLPPVPPDATPARILPVGSFAPFEDAE